MDGVYDYTQTDSKPIEINWDSPEELEHRMKDYDSEAEYFTARWWEIGTP